MSDYSPNGKEVSEKLLTLKLGNKLQNIHRIFVLWLPKEGGMTPLYEQCTRKDLTRKFLKDSHAGTRLSHWMFSFISIKLYNIL